MRTTFDGEILLVYLIETALKTCSDRPETTRTGTSFRILFRITISRRDRDPGPKNDLLLRELQSTYERSIDHCIDLVKATKHTARACVTYIHWPVSVVGLGRIKLSSEKGNVVTKRHQRTALISMSRNEHEYSPSTRQ